MNIVQDKGNNIANFEWTCQGYVWLSYDQYELVYLNLKPYQCRFMHWTWLVNHWLWPSTVQSNWWPFLPRVQSALLFWVGDHNHCQLICILTIFALQSINVIAKLGMFIMLVNVLCNLFSPGCPNTWWNHFIVSTTIASGNAKSQMGWAGSFL